MKDGLRIRGALGMLFLEKNNFLNSQWIYPFIAVGLFALPKTPIVLILLYALACLGYFLLRSGSKKHIALAIIVVFTSLVTHPL